MQNWNLSVGPLCVYIILKSVKYFLEGVFFSRVFMNYLPDVAISPTAQKIFDFEGGEDVALDFFTHLFKRIIEMAIEIAK